MPSCGSPTAAPDPSAHGGQDVGGEALQVLDRRRQPLVGVRRLARRERRHADQVVQPGLARRRRSCRRGAARRRRRGTPTASTPPARRDRARPAPSRPAPPPPPRRPARASTRRCGSRCRSAPTLRMGRRRLAADPDRDVRPLHRQRVGADVAVVHPAPVEAARAVLRPQVDARGHELVGHRAAVGPQVVDAEGLELLAPSSRRRCRG